MTVLLGCAIMSQQACLGACERETLCEDDARSCRHGGYDRYRFAGSGQDILLQNKAGCLHRHLRIEMLRHAREILGGWVRCRPVEDTRNQSPRGVARGRQVEPGIQRGSPQRARPARQRPSRSQDFELIVCGARGGPRPQLRHRRFYRKRKTRFAVIVRRTMQTSGSPGCRVDNVLARCRTARHRSARRQHEHAVFTRP